MWIFPWIKPSWHSCSVWNKPGLLNWLWQFHYEGLSSFNPTKFYYSYAWFYSSYERRTSFCLGLISRKLCGFFMFLTSFTWLSALLLFPLSITFFVVIHGFYSISSNVGEIILIDPFANEFVFGTFNVHHKDWLIYSGGTHRRGELCYNFSISGELCYNFSISNNLTQMINFPTQIPDCDSHSPAVLDLFLLMIVFLLQRLFLHWEIFSMLLSQFPLTFCRTQNGIPCFIA